MLERFADPETARRLDVETLEMLAIRGGAEKILFADPRPDLNGRTLAELATDWAMPVPHAVRRIITERNATVILSPALTRGSSKLLEVEMSYSPCENDQSYSRCGDERSMVTSHGPPSAVRQSSSAYQFSAESK